MRPFFLSSNQRLSKRRVATLSAQRARPDRCRNTERASWKRRAARRGSDSAAAICRRHQATAGSSSTVVAGPQGRRRARTPVEMPYDHELIASIDTDRTRKFGAASSGPLKDPFAMQATLIGVRAGTGGGRSTTGAIEVGRHRETDGSAPARRCTCRQSPRDAKWSSDSRRLVSRHSKLIRELECDLVGDSSVRGIDRHSS